MSTKPSSTKNVEIEEIQAVSEPIESALPEKDEIKQDHIGLKKTGFEGMVQVHKNMKAVYEKAGFEIIEPKAKKK